MSSCRFSSSGRRGLSFAITRDWVIAIDCKDKSGTNSRWVRALTASSGIPATRRLSGEAFDVFELKSTAPGARRHHRPTTQAHRKFWCPSDAAPSPTVTRAGEGKTPPRSEKEKDLRWDATSCRARRRRTSCSEAGTYVTQNGRTARRDPRLAESAAS